LNEPFDKRTTRASNPFVMSGNMGQNTRTWNTLLMRNSSCGTAAASGRRSTR
jgi:hypothetical protein